MLHRLKSLIPFAWLQPYHWLVSWAAAVRYGHPSDELIVIGVTGTNGKTTTSYLIAKALEAAGTPTGCTTTALFKIGEREWLNDKKMTMLGRFALQRMLREMVEAGCTYAVIETSSQGIVQFRHRHVNYDVAVFTNLTPEHIEAHGGFENYKRAKQELFFHLARSRRKIVNGGAIPKSAIIHAADPYGHEMAVNGLDRVMWYRTNSEVDHVDPHGQIRVMDEMVAREVECSARGVAFTTEGVRATLRLPGEVNVLNGLAALSTARVLHVPLEEAASRLAALPGVPGRFEWIEEGQSWNVMVDYAPEPASLAQLYATLQTIPHARLIHVLGSCGGGRDVARRPVLGRMAGEAADLVIVTNEDPYDDDPREIMNQVAAGAREAGKREGENLLIIEDRRAAIEEAMRRAAPGDIVLLTGKGSEQAICVADGHKIPWDEREVAREAIRAVLATAATESTLP